MVCTTVKNTHMVYSTDLYFSKLAFKASLWLGELPKLVFMCVFY